MTELGKKCPCGSEETIGYLGFSFDPNGWKQPICQICADDMEEKREKLRNSPEQIELRERLAEVRRMEAEIMSDPVRRDDFFKYMYGDNK